ncbi:DUF805 domain-containing protein [Dongshaea marina]|uniref:DUF805 domain-containing protein n=1 Tax=Dongshaea marina TaxID=2047966 RepID=UPI000D3E83A4|nr:DUF805 domain-containing protein [Dongshaea marina]
MHWYLAVLKKYAVFSGRAQRKEYWMFTLVNFIISLLLILFTGLNEVGWIATLYLLVLIIPNLSVGVRRLHDTNRSGWWMLLLLIPLIGPLILLVFFCSEGEHSANRFGENPKLAATMHLW